MDILRLYDIIKSLRSDDRTVIVGIDGLGGAGKSTVSKKLFDELTYNGISTALLHIDDFIYPKNVRYNDSFEPWECYYKLQWRYDYLINDILKPIKKGAGFAGNIELYDKDNDTYFLSRTEIPVGSVVIIEGVFLQRKELEGVFDHMIYIDVPEQTRLERVLGRDLYIGGSSDIIKKYNERYFPAERHYVAKCSPAQNADTVV